MQLKGKKSEGHFSSRISKSLVVGVVVGLIIGLGLGYVVTIQGVGLRELEQQLTQLNETINTLRGEIREKDREINELKDQISDPHPVAPFHVSGRYVFDGYGREVSMKGFQVKGAWNYTQYELQRIKEWGFHFVYSDQWWGKLELEAGGYNNEALHEFGRNMNMCAEEDIYWIYRFRVSFDDNDPPSWQGWPRAGYVCTEAGLQRYINMLEWAISGLESRYSNIVAYHMWQYPFHQTLVTQEQKEFYYNRVIPAMVEAARKYTDKPLIVSSLRCLPEEFSNIKKVVDDAVIYGFAYYEPQVHGSSPDEPEWNGTQTEIDEQWNMLQNAVDFMNIHNVPINIVEFGIRKDRVDQINKLRLKLQIFDYYEFSGWCYWEYAWFEDEGFSICYSNGIFCKWGIVEALKEYRNWNIGT